MPDERLVPDFKIKINGSPLDTKIVECLQWVEVEMSIKLLDMATLSFDNPEGIIGDKSEFSGGNEVEIEVGFIGEIEPVFKGEIISLEPHFPAGGGSPSVVVRCYDKLHKYRRGKKTRTFANQKVSDVIQTLAGEEGLSVDVKSTSVQQPWMLQNNQSNIEMIKELARSQGFEVTVVDQAKLHVKPPRHDKGKALSLNYHENLKSFYVRKSTANIPTKVFTHYWDMKQKKSIVENADQVEGALKPSSDIVAEAKKAFGDAELHITIRPDTAPAEAKALAASVFNEAALGAVQGRGTCVGEPKMKPGLVLELDGLGKEWSGLYYLTGTTHLLHRTSGYSTAFKVKRTGSGSSMSARPLIEPTPPPPEEDPADDEQSTDMSARVSRA